MEKSIQSHDGAVGLISIHLAFYQMNPWSTAKCRIINLWELSSREPNFLLSIRIFVDVDAAGILQQQ